MQEGGVLAPIACCCRDCLPGYRSAGLSRHRLRLNHNAGPCAILMGSSKAVHFPRALTPVESTVPQSIEALDFEQIFQRAPEKRGSRAVDLMLGS